MIKKLALTFCAIGATWAGGFAPAAFAQQPIDIPVPPPVTAPEPVYTPPTPTATPEPANAPVSPATPQQALSNATLTLEDLPEGFQELSPQMAAQVLAQLEALRPQLAQGGLKPDKFFAFIHPKNFQVVMGFTGMLPNQPEQASFDAGLKQLQDPEVQQVMVSQMREELKQSPGIEFLNYSLLPAINNLAESATGMSLAVSMQGQPIRMDVASFRRNAVGAFAAVMYTDGQAPSISLDDVARKLDNRILQLHPAATPVRREE